MPQNRSYLHQSDPAETGLRQRQKAQRRDDILNASARLFEDQGFDATTQAEIARAVGVSPPTISNYFGSKENILIALISEGAEYERAEHLKRPRKTGLPFAEVIGDLLCDASERTMKIAGKRVWRYGEAASIRRPNTDFEQKFAQNDVELFNLMAAVLDDYDIVLRSGTPPDIGFLARMLFDRWTARYLEYIKDDAMEMTTHKAALRADAAAMTALLLEDEFAAASPLKRQDLPS